MGKNTRVVTNFKQELIDKLNLSHIEDVILINDDVIQHIKQEHKNDFYDEAQFYKHLNSISDIIDNPDYIGIHPLQGSMLFIKKIDEITLVAIRVSKNNKFWVKTLFPISSSKLNNYLQNNTVIKV